jgi:hypothetical protein
LTRKNYDRFRNRFHETVYAGLRGRHKLIREGNGRTVGDEELREVNGLE